MSLNTEALRPVWSGVTPTNGQGNSEGEAGLSSPFPASPFSRTPGGTVTRLSEPDEIRAAAAGNRLAQSALVTRHTPKVYALARRMVRDEAAAEDITQEAFLRLWKVLPDWEPRAKLSTWLYRVTLNLCRDYGRKKREATVDELPERIDPGLRPDELAEQNERLNALHAAIQSLPERQCEALTLCGMEGHTNIEAAEILEISVEALESLLARARRKLRANLFDKTGAVV